ncbi:MAG: nucleoside hydrolase-like domain-containing protein [Leadbetterella sp.]
MLKLLTLFLIFTSNIFAYSQNKRDVFVFTDINIDAGDPDDRQSLIHLLWYADELNIKGIVPDRWNAKGYEACQLVLDEYKKDFAKYGWGKKKFSKPKSIEKIIAKDKSMAEVLLVEAAKSTKTELYVLVWGNMKVFSEILLKHPTLSSKIKLITIGTGLMLEQHRPNIPKDWPKYKPCEQPNWNGEGRNEIYKDARFDTMWWLEINWAYMGMFSGQEPKNMLEDLTKFGNMGRNMKEVVKTYSWSQYFRAGDTPSVLYVLDKNHDLSNPNESSWAGKYIKALPLKKPNYFTDWSGDIVWDYQNPCETWQNHAKVNEFSIRLLEQRRQEMYDDLMRKLKKIYP